MVSGVHTSTAGGVALAVERAYRLGCSTLQIFSSSPRQWKPYELGKKQCEAMRQLRAGKNGWTCMPSTPTTFGPAAGQDPMCVDHNFMGWAEAWMSKKDPQVKSAGVAYMLKGDKGASNTDPFATGPTPNNQWVTSGPHIMVLYPDLKTLDAYPTDPKSGGPWVMWKGTPYAHLMVPVATTRTATMSSR